MNKNIKKYYLHAYLKVKYFSYLHVTRIFIGLEYIQTNKIKFV